MVVVNCQCSSRFQVGDEWAGKQARCPVCNAVVPVPISSPSPEPAPTGPQFAPPTQPTPAVAAEADAALKTVHDELQTRVEQQAAPVTSPSSVPQPAAETDERDSGDQTVTILLLAMAGIVVIVLGGLGAYVYSTSSSELEVIASASAPVESNKAKSIDPPDEVVVSEPKEKAKQATAKSKTGGMVETTQHDPSELKHTPSEPVVPDTKSPPDEVVPPRETPNRTKGSGNVQKAGSGLSGISSQYDDFHCQRIQSQFAWRVPSAAEFLEVDGERLPITNLSELRTVRAPYLFLPRGEHAIRLRSGEQPVRTEIGEHLDETSAAMRKFFRAGSSIQTDELLARGARAMDVHGAPFLLNMTGAAYIADNQWEAAERKFRRGLVVNPLYAPAHLNLAVCLLKQNDTVNATRELHLADALNIGNVFGLSAALNRLRQQHDIDRIPDDAIALDVSQYVSAEPMSEEDERLTALMTAMSKYAVREEDRGKILNNLAVHFAETGKTETALQHFRSALAVLKFAGPDRFTIAEKVRSHMESACRVSGFPEAEEYASMRKSVLP